MRPAGVVSGLLAISAGDDFNCVEYSTGPAYCWGKDTFGQTDKWGGGGDQLASYQAFIWSDNPFDPLNPTIPCITIEKKPAPLRTGLFTSNFTQLIPSAC